MAELTTTYLGIKLRNPIIAGSSGLTSDLEHIKQLEKNGVGAVVLKSLFEEQIILDAEYEMRQSRKNQMIYSERSESLDYIDYHIKEHYLNNYLELVKDVKEHTTLPVIGSINCITSGEWVNFARKIQDAGADAIELNIAMLNTNPNKSAIDVETAVLELVQKISRTVTIPVTVKLSPYFCNLSQLVNKLQQTGVSGLVLFNRYFSPDINVQEMEVSSGNIYSSPNEYSNSLRWISILSEKNSIDFVGATGIHDGNTALKFLLSGAKAVQIVSGLYKNGFELIPKMLDDMEQWMNRNNYNYVDQFIGALNQYKSKEASSYERIQFMRYYSGIGNMS
ncbi:MAG TPA: dihydroorotate dehydrogenase-like protein [Bacteroidales bacterium]|nr:dihydroorotate dehydrogenase-like protein [Bacteroidales bacterium]